MTEREQAIEIANKWLSNDPGGPTKETAEADAMLRVVARQLIMAIEEINALKRELLW
jgi:hypothetical protein